MRRTRAKLRRITLTATAALALSCSSSPPRGLAIDTGSYDRHVAGTYYTESGIALDFVFHMTSASDAWPKSGSIDVGVAGVEVFRQLSDASGELQELRVGGADVLQLGEDGQEAALRAFFEPAAGRASYADILDLDRALADQPQDSLGHVAHLAFLPGLAWVEEVFPPSVHHQAGGGRDPRYCCTAECNSEENDCHAFCGEETGRCFDQCKRNHPIPGHELNVCNQECLLYSTSCHDLCATVAQLCRERCPI
jgi:hypothetical protein